MLDHLAFDTAIFALLPMNQASAQMLLSEMSLLATQLYVPTTQDHWSLYHVSLTRYTSQHLSLIQCHRICLLACSLPIFLHRKVTWGAWSVSTYSLGPPLTAAPLCTSTPVSGIVPDARNQEVNEMTKLTALVEFRF